MKEYIWSLTVDGEEKDWKCVVYDEDIATFEDDAETHHLPIETKAKNVVQIDEAISVYGKKVHFQLENNTPYIKIGGKWTMSDTTMAERQVKMEQIQNTTTIVQIVMGLLMCAISLAVYFTNGDFGRWWFMIIVGTVMIAMGIMSRVTARQEKKEAAKKAAENAEG